MLDVVMIGIVLFIITVFIILQLFTMPLQAIVLIILASLLVIPIWKKCQSLRSPLRKTTFWKVYWYDMKCKLVVIIYGVSVSWAISEII
jgi:hypothetical protein